VVVLRTVKPGHEAQYEAWLSRAMAAARAFPGHLGADVVRQGAQSRQYALIFRYAALEQLLAWEQSPERGALVAEAEALSELPAVVTRTEGVEAWFTLPGPGAAVPPPKAKMALVSWAVSFPLIVLLTALLGPVLAPLPQVAKVAVVSAVMVVAMTWVVMPNVTRLLATWLYRR